MERAAFEYVYLNANCMAEMAMYQTEDNKAAYAADQMPDKKKQEQYFDQILQRAYSIRAQLTDAIDQTFAQIDMHDLDIMMYAVPEDLSPLTGPLTGSDLAKWIECYHMGFYAVNKVAQMVRSVGGVLA
jgi:hypothetical protein